MSDDPASDPDPAFITLARLGERLAVQGQRVATVCADIEALRDDITVRRGLRSADTSRAREEIERQRVALSARVDCLLSGVVAIRDDIVATTQLVERTDAASDHTRDEIRLLNNIATVLQRQIERLQEQMRALTDEP
jgi:chromosome segregation ATPase